MLVVDQPAAMVLRRWGYQRPEPGDLAHKQCMWQRGPRSRSFSLPLICQELDGPPPTGDRDRRAVFPFPPQPFDCATQWGTLFVDRLRALTRCRARRLSRWQRDDSLRALCAAVLDALAHTFVIHDAQWRQRLRWTVRHWVATQFPFMNDEDPYPSPAVSTLSPSPTSLTSRGRRAGAWPACPGFHQPPVTVSGTAEATQI